MNPTRSLKPLVIGGANGREGGRPPGEPSPRQRPAERNRLATTDGSTGKCHPLRCGITPRVIICWLAGAQFEAYGVWQYPTLLMGPR